MFMDNPKPHFKGADYIPKIDYTRLDSQIQKIKRLMLDGQWRTYSEVNRDLNTSYPEPSISAQFRNLRKDDFGGFTVNRRRRTITGLNEYQVLKQSIN
jgi:hypothetical protein